MRRFWEGLNEKYWRLDTNKMKRKVAQIVTLKELCLTIGKSEGTILRNFARTQENLKKKGILIMKWGEGRSADYEIEYFALD